MLTRRSLLSAPLTAAAPLLPVPAAAGPSLAVLAVLAELEAWQGWECLNVASAKAYAAHRLRQALHMDLPDPTLARHHLALQRQQWEAYTRTIQYERDRAEGKHYSPPPASLAWIGDAQ